MTRHVTLRVLTRRLNPDGDDFDGNLGAFAFGDGSFHPGEDVVDLTDITFRTEDKSPTISLLQHTYNLTVHWE